MNRLDYNNLELKEPILEKIARNNPEASPRRISSQEIFITFTSDGILETTRWTISFW